jgi:ketosteroid isomerase-like protein
MRHAFLLLAGLIAAALPAHAGAQTAPRLSVEQRVQQLEDRETIRQILIDYASALDERNIDAYVALFAKNGQWINGSMVRNGPEEIRGLLTGMFRNVPPGFVNRESFEIVFNPRVQVTGDRATARSGHLLFRRAPDGSPLPALFGRYEDEFVREHGAWKILKRVDIPTLPTPEEWGAIMRARQQQPQQKPAQ